MSSDVERGVEMYHKACLTEEQGKFNLAELYYLKSAYLFQRAGGAHHMDAANVLNALAFLLEASGLYDEALRSAKESAKIMETQAGELCSRDADMIRLQAWGLIGNLYRHMARYAEAEQTLRRAFDYAIVRFGDAEKRPPRPGSSRYGADCQQPGRIIAIAGTA